MSNQITDQIMVAARELADAQVQHDRNVRSYVSDLVSWDAIVRSGEAWTKAEARLRELVEGI